MVTPGFIWNACLPSFAKLRCEAVDRPQPTENPEEGSGTVLAVGIIAALLILATVIIGFAGLLVAILKSDEIRGMLVDMVKNALATGGSGLTFGLF